MPAPGEFNRRVARRGTPVILEGLLADWPALGSWSVELFAERYGNCRWNVIRRENGAYSSPTLYGADDPVDVGDHLRRVFASETEDYLSVPLNTLPPELEAMVPPLPFAVGARHCQRGMFVGAEINGTPLHFHLCQNLLSQVAGTKRVLLYHWRHSRGLGWAGPRGGTPNFIESDAFAPDPFAWAEERGVRGYLVDLQPGDALYIPLGWWHATQTLAPSISVFDRWASGWRYIPAAASLLADSVVAFAHHMSTMRRGPAAPPKAAPER